MLLSLRAAGGNPVDGSKHGRSRFAMAIAPHPR
jgi:hypothetical protein